MKIILASASPRRQELLTKAGILFDTIPSCVEEIFNKDIPVEEAVMDLAYQKAKWVKDTKNTDDLIIGADTIVVINKEVLGKPKNHEEAVRMLSLLQNAVHEVITGVSLIKGGKTINFYEKTLVFFSIQSLSVQSFPILPLQTLSDKYTPLTFLHSFLQEKDNNSHSNLFPNQML
jgi:septum formation protein